MPNKEPIVYTKPVSDVRFTDHFTPSFWRTEYCAWNQPTEKQINVRDPLTDELYLNDSRFIIRNKFLILNIAVPIFYTYLVAASILLGIIKLCILFGMWCCGYSSQESIYRIPSEALKIFLAPFILIAAEVTVLLGLIFPLNARKIFASIERLFIDNYYIPHYIFISLKVASIKKLVKFENGIDVKECQTKFEENSQFRDLLDTQILGDAETYNRVLNKEISHISNTLEIPITDTDLLKVKKIIYSEREKFILALCFQPKQKINAHFEEDPNQESYTVTYS